MSKIRVIIAGGGTGGHFFPAIAIGNELKSRGSDVMYIGSHYGIEAEKLKVGDELMVSGETKYVIKRIMVFNGEYGTYTIFINSNWRSHMDCACMLVSLVYIKFSK